MTKLGLLTLCLIVGTVYANDPITVIMKNANDTIKTEAIPVGKKNSYKVSVLGGSGTTTYQWKRDGVVQTETTDTYEFTADSTPNEDVEVSCRVIKGGVTNNTAKVNIIVFDVSINKIAFNHDTGDHDADALNIRQDYATPLTVPEYGYDDNISSPAAYIRNKTVKIKVEFSCEPTSITSMKIKGEAADNNEILGDVTETTLNFSEGTSDFILMDISDNTPNEVCYSEESWDWVATKVNSKPALDQPFKDTSGHKIYTIYDEPKEPWSTAVNNQNNPWVDALEFAISNDKIGCKDESIAVNIMDKITDYLYNDMNFEYEASYGAPSFEFRPGYGDAFNYTEYIASLNSTKVNCSDQAAGLFVSATLLGLDAIFEAGVPWGFINKTDLVGIGGCNNPMFERSYISHIQLIGTAPNYATDLTDVIVPPLLQPRSLFSFHSYAIYNNSVYDATAGPTTSSSRGTFYNDTIDITTAYERTKSKDSDNNGSLSSAEIDAMNFEYKITIK